MAPDQWPNTAPPGHSSDFDFLVGHWHARHRQLAERLKNSSQWIAFDGTCEAWSPLGGQASVDDNLIRKPSGTYRAATIRIFDPESAAWSIYWIDSRYPPTTMTGPVMGGFAGKVGLFFWDGDYEGRRIRTRFLWQVDGADRCRFEQAFSPDDGKNWEPNWQIQLERTA